MLVYVTSVTILFALRLGRFDQSVQCKKWPTWQISLLLFLLTFTTLLITALAAMILRTRCQSFKKESISFSLNMRLGK